MKPVQIRIQTRLEIFDRDPVGSARSVIGANTLPRKL